MLLLQLIEDAYFLTAVKCIKGLLFQLEGNWLIIKWQH